MIILFKIIFSMRQRILTPIAEARVFEEAKSRASKMEIGGVFRMWTIPDVWTRLIESVQMGHEMKAGTTVAIGSRSAGR